MELKLKPHVFLNTLGMTRVYANELNKYKLNSQYHYN